MPRNLKYWKKRFGAIDTVAYHHHLDFRTIPDLNDEGLAYQLANVKGVNMLDLNETEITNASIILLTKLEYVNELRLKGCIGIDNDCIAVMNKLTCLQLLHIKDTNITIDGLLNLTNLQNLKKLMFSDGDQKSIQEKVLQLKALLPGCELTINSKPWP